MFNSIFTVETVKKSYCSIYIKIYLFIERERDIDRGGEGERGRGATLRNNNITSRSHHHTKRQILLDNSLSRSFSPTLNFLVKL